MVYWMYFSWGMSMLTLVVYGKQVFMWLFRTVIWIGDTIGEVIGREKEHPHFRERRRRKRYTHSYNTRERDQDMYDSEEDSVDWEERETKEENGEDGLSVSDSWKSAERGFEEEEDEEEDEDYQDGYQARRVSVDDWINNTAKQARGYLILCLVIGFIILCIFFAVMVIQTFVSKYEDALLNYNKYQSTVYQCTEYGLTDPVLLGKCKEAREKTQKNILIFAAGDCLIEVWKTLELGLIHLLFSPVLWVIVASVAFVVVFYVFKPRRRRYIPAPPMLQRLNTMSHPQYHAEHPPMQGMRKRMITSSPAGTKNATPSMYDRNAY
jgi:hypothetical protein